MFSLIRHAGYHLGTGSLTPDGTADAKRLAESLKAGGDWHEIRTSPSARTRETANILASELGIPVISDERLGMDGSVLDLLPPTEPDGIIFVSHLPVLTKMLRAWSKEFRIEEPPLTEIASGYFVDPSSRSIRAVVETR